MPKAKKQSFEHLSPAERQLVGEPDDYAWEDAINLPARSRSNTVQFSLRLDRDIFEALQNLSKERHETFSDVVRQAIDRYVRTGGRPAISNIQVTFRGDLGMLVQVEGGRAEMSTSRRLRDPNERTSTSIDPAHTW